MSMNGTARTPDDEEENPILHVPSEELIALLYRELHDLASSWMARECSAHTLTATGLVHEAYLRLGPPGRAWPNRALFFAAAGEAMNRVLIDHARRKKAAKRGGGRGAPLALDPHDGPEPFGWTPDFTGLGAGHDVLRVSDAVEELRRVDPVAHRVVMLRFFAGLTEREAAEAIGLSERQVRRIWAGARAWLSLRLGRGAVARGAEP